MKEKSQSLDSYDYSILSMLEKDASKPISYYSKQLHKSKEFCTYRISRLRKLGVISIVVAVINTEKLGFNTYNFLFELQEITNLEKQKFEQYLIKSPFTKYLQETSGKWDYEVSIMVKKISELSFFLEELHSIFGKYIKSNNFHLRTKTLYYGSFLNSILNTKQIQEKNNEKKKIQTCNYELKELDYDVLEILSKDSTLSVKEIAQKLDSSFNKIRYSIDNLKSSGIIRHQYAKINSHYFGYNTYSILLKIKDLTSKRKESFISFLKMNRYVYFCVRIIGNWDIRVQVVAKDQNDVRTFIYELREELGESLQYYDFSLYIKELKRISFIKK